MYGQKKPFALFAIRYIQQVEWDKVQDALSIVLFKNPPIFLEKRQQIRQYVCSGALEAMGT